MHRRRDPPTFGRPEWVAVLKLLHEARQVHANLGSLSEMESSFIASYFSFGLR
jgi:hypothetical protein